MKVNSDQAVSTFRPITFVIEVETLNELCLLNDIFLNGQTTVGENDKKLLQIIIDELRKY